MALKLLKLNIAEHIFVTATWLQRLLCKISQVLDFYHFFPIIGKGSHNSEIAGSGRCKDFMFSAATWVDDTSQMDPNLYVSQSHRSKKEIPEIP